MRLGHTDSLPLIAPLKIFPRAKLLKPVPSSILAALFSAESNCCEGHFRMVS